MQLALKETPLAEVPSPAALVFCFEGENPLLTPAPAGAPVQRRFARMLRAWVKERGFTGSLYQTALLPTWETLPAGHLLLVGLGARKAFDRQRLERVMATAVRALRSAKLSHLSLSAAAPRPGRWVSDEVLGEACAQGIGSGSYAVNKAQRRAPSKAVTITFTGVDKKQKAGLRRGFRKGQLMQEVFREVKDLANLPGNLAPPAKVAQVARKLASRYKLRCRVWGPAELKRERCGALLAVGQGSRQTPRLVTLTYPGRTKEPPLVLVGKAITFDTGGISLKPPKSMEWMRYDKCGGMAVLAAVCALARLGASRPVIGILAAAENMPGGNAIRPGDTVRTRSGKSVEVLNTDAEGRLVLADALDVACGYAPAAIMDVATLTGAVISALGHERTGLMGNKEPLLEAVREAASRCGDPVWPLPLLPEHDESLQSSFADLKNIGGGGGAGSSTAGAFLKAFVKRDVPWAHLDVAGTAWLEATKPYADAGATLAGAPLMVEWVECFSQTKR